MNYKTFIIPIFLLMGVFTSCNKNSNKIPDNIIPKDKMINILTDVQLVEAKLKLNKNKKDTNIYYSNYYYNFIFKKYNITNEDYKNSINYYNQNINELNDIYTEIITNLSKKEIIKKK